MQIKLYNTLTKSVEELSLGTEVSYYCCGPTVYAAAHIGNFRTFVVQDLFRRVLEISGYKVRHVRNITDVDDKTIRLSEEKSQKLTDFTTKWTKIFREDSKKLNLLTPTSEPLATEYIPEQIDLIQKLENKGFAYKAEDGSVYFKISEFGGYGKLSGVEISADSSSFGRLASSLDEYTKDNVADFVLWKARREEDGDNYWDSPWGEGRPGWHTECSAMSMDILGESIDIHSGGVDLCFPHHENEICQVEALTNKNFSKYWFHVTHLMVEGQKMSKSLGNMYTLHDLEKQVKDYSSLALRMSLLLGHYQKQLNFTFQSLNDSKNNLDKIAKFRSKLLETASEYIEPKSFADAVASGLNALENCPEFFEVYKALLNNLNTPKAFAELFKAIKSNQVLENPLASLKALDIICYTLGLEGIFSLSLQKEEEQKAPALIQELANRRNEAKTAKNWGLADSLRDEIMSKGWKIVDKPDGFTLEKI